MGAILSLNDHKASMTNLSKVSQSEVCMRQRRSTSFRDDNLRLIPSLPDEISLQILARLPRILHFNAKLVSRGWKAALTSGELYKMRKELGTTEEWLYILTKNDGDKFLWYALDPVSRIWQRLPQMSKVGVEDGSRKDLLGLRLWKTVSSNIKIVDSIVGWLGKKDAFDNIRCHGCSIGAVDGRLYVLGGFSGTAALKSVWRYEPAVNCWSEVAPMSTARAYCKTGVLHDKLYVVGGVTWGQGSMEPLQSAEVFDPQTGIWSELPSMPFSKAQILPTAFLAELLKPIATGITSYMGKLYVPQSLYCCPFFVDIGGEGYDPETNSWVEMPSGMGEGWPSKQSGTKLSVTMDGGLYSLDPSSSLDSLTIKTYDHQDDSWKIIEGDLPISTDSESPQLLAGFLGKLHLITKATNHNIVVVQADRQNQFVSAASTSASSLGISLQEFSQNVARSPQHIWKVFAAKSAGSTELISCQILDI